MKLQLSLLAIALISFSCKPRSYNESAATAEDEISQPGKFTQTVRVEIVDLFGKSEAYLSNTAGKKSYEFKATPQQGWGDAKYNLNLNNDSNMTKSTLEIVETISNTNAQAQVNKLNIDINRFSKPLATQRTQRALVALQAIKSEAALIFYTDKSAKPYQNPLKSTYEMGAHRWSGCKIRDFGEYICPETWVVKYPSGMNEVTFKKITQENATLVTADDAVKNLSSRLENAVKENPARKAKLDAFQDFVAALGSKSDFIYCEGGYWAPSVNAEFCYFINIPSGNITVVVHGDNDG